MNVAIQLAPGSARGCLRRPTINRRDPRAEPGANRKRIRRPHAAILPMLVCLGAIGVGAVGAPPASAGGTTRPVAPPLAAPPLEGGKFPLTSPPDIDVDAAMNSDVRGRLAIKAVQGTPDGPPVRAANVIVQLVHQGMVIETIEDQLDDHGVVMLEDLPIAMGVTPVVEIAHAGVTYRQSAAMLTGAEPEQMIEVVCYEVTDVAPDWKIQMRHVMLSTSGGHLSVNEILQIVNPAQRTWTGAPQPEGKPRTTSLVLTEGAHDLTLGRGFHDWCCTTFAEGELINHLPLMPEVTEISFRYLLPAGQDAAVLDVQAPVPVQHLMIIIPEEINAAPIAGLESAGGSTIGETRVNFFVATDLAADERVSVALTGRGGTVATPPPNAAGSTGPGSSPVSIAKVIAAIGGGILVLLALVIMLSRSARPAAP